MMIFPTCLDEVQHYLLEIASIFIDKLLLFFLSFPLFWGVTGVDV